MPYHITTKKPESSCYEIRTLIGNTRSLCRLCPLLNKPAEPIPCIRYQHLLAANEQNKNWWEEGNK
jgi:hypothetical protein